MEAEGSVPKGANEIEAYDRLLAANMLVDGGPLGVKYQDQYRRIKQPLLSNAFGKTASLVEQGNLILVTSSVPGEGKTTVACNVALAMSQLEKTLVIDADLRRPSTKKIFDL